jgi:hypothetical protein
LGLHAGGRSPGVGKVRTVVSFAHEALSGRPMGLVTNRVDGSAATISGLDSQRWPTATCYQDCKGQVGVSESRRRSPEALGRHWGLVFVAHSLLHLTCLPPVPDRTKGLIHTMGDACRHQGRALLQQLPVVVPDQWSHGAPPDDVLARLCAKQRGMVPVWSLWLLQITTVESTSKNRLPHKILRLLSESLQFVTPG